MLQDIEPFHLNNAFLTEHAKEPDEKSVLILREGNQLWCRFREGKLELPMVAELHATPAEEQKAPTVEDKGQKPLRYLIAVDDTRFYMPVKDIRPQLKALGYEAVPAREIRYAEPAWLRFGALTAWQAAGWYANNRFCGRCGGEMAEGTEERSLICPECGSTIYPKLCPVVITAVTNGERILLTKYAGRDKYARFALVAGFAEIGETIEQTVAREVMEETGLKVKNLRYYKSQPWAYSESLLFGFYCDVDGSDDVNVDLNELSDAVWTDRKDIPDYGDEISLTYEMMRTFREGKEPK